MKKSNIVKRIYRKIARVLKFYFRMRGIKKLGIAFTEPNYIYLDVFDESSVIIDVGCADDADFSVYMIEKYGLKSFGVDPTLRRVEPLGVLEEKTNGRFKHLQLAVSSTEGSVVFNESSENVSGSLYSDHTNVLNDKCRSYEVEAVTLEGLIKKVGVEKVDFIKLDTEGAEYDMLSEITEEDLSPFRQIFIEFHHHAFERFSEDDTKAIIKSICEKGFDSFTLDDHNYLFFKNN